MYQPSFFEYAMRGEGGRRTRKFLEEMKGLIPYKEIEAMLYERGIYKRTPSHRGGRPRVPASIMIGILFLQSWYNLSDPMAEEMIHDRLSFREFLGIKEAREIPDETTICNFRNILVKQGLMEEIFEIVNALMRERNLILDTGTLVDATLIHSSEPKRRRDGKGEVISNEAADPDASYTSKRGRKYHGFKFHIGTDRNGMIKRVSTTTAKASDTKEFDRLTKGERHAAFADSAYMSRERKRTLRKNNIFVGIIERRVRGQKELRPKQKRNNRRFAPIRSFVEHSFATLKRWMGYTQTRYRGLHKVSQHHFLLAASCNLRRAPGVKARLKAI